MSQSWLESQAQFPAEVIKVDSSGFLPVGDVSRTPDIYLLTYDSYVAQETMRQYGIDNSAQERHLVEKGFKLYPKAYSIKSDSRGTMARVLEMSDELVQKNAFSTAGNSLVTKSLEDLGYDTYGILTPYLLASPNIGYGTSFPELASGAAAVYAGVESGQFSFDLIDKTYNHSRSDFIDKKTADIRRARRKPKFMYTHTGPGHSQNSGSCLWNETELLKSDLLKQTWK